MGLNVWETGRNGSAGMPRPITSSGNMQCRFLPPLAKRADAPFPLPLPPLRLRLRTAKRILPPVKRWCTAIAALLLAAAAAGGAGNDGGSETISAPAAGVQAYFDRYNADIAEVPWNGTGPRQVTWVQKVTAFERDGWKCIVCGSAGPLELDHARALMNGGDNSLENLHTLCHDCHVAKTRLDFALRRHRMDLNDDILPGDPERESETHHAREAAE